MTLQEINENTPGGMSVLPKGGMTGAPPNLTLTWPSVPTPTATPQPTATPRVVDNNNDYYSQLEAVKQRALQLKANETVSEPTVGQTLSFSPGTYDPYPSYESIYGPEPDQKQIMRDQLRLYQTEIDATNQIYDQLLNQARLEGQGRIGSQRAISARGGILGSDFSVAQKQKVQDYNTGIERGIQSERLAAIGAIMGNVRSSVRDEMEAKRTARQQGAENYLAYLSASGERKENNLSLLAQDFVAQGVDPNELDPQELGAIAKEAGTTTKDLLARYSRELASQAPAEDKRYTLSAGERLVDGQGNLIAEGGNKPGTIYSTSNGLVRIDDQGNAQLVYSVPKSSGGGSGAAITSGSLSVSKDELSEFSKELESSRGEDGYANTAYYMENLNSFVQNGGLIADFIKEFDPDNYLNPNDPTIPPAVKNAMKSTSFGFSFEDL